MSYEDGHKLQWSKADLQDLKDRCNEQSRQQGLHVPEKWKTFYGEEREDTVAWNKETYRRLKQAEKGEVKSYVQEIALAIMDCKETATSRETFMEQMQAKGYGVDWQDKHKYITFVDLARQQQGERQCKVRNNKLESYYAVDFGKETLENGFESNARREKNRADAEEYARRQLDRAAVTENNGADERERARQQLNQAAAQSATDAFIEQLDAQERIAEEKRNDSIAEREANETKRQRHSFAGKQATKGRKQTIRERSRRSEEYDRSNEMDF